MFEDIDEIDTIILRLDDDPLPLPSDYEFVFIEEEDNVASTSDEIEKGLLSAMGAVGGKVVQFFRGFFGRWVTLENGRRIFIKLKGIFGSDVRAADTRMATTAFKKLPLSIRKAMGSVQVKSRNIVERIMEGTTVARLLGKERPFYHQSGFIGKAGYRVSFFKQMISSTRVNIPGFFRNVTERVRRSPKWEIRAFKVEAYERKPDGGYQKVWKTVRKKVLSTGGFDYETSKRWIPPTSRNIVTESNSFYIVPGRLRVLEELQRSGKIPIGGKLVKRPGLDITDIVNRGGAYSLYPSYKTASSAIEGWLDRMVYQTNKEGGVSQTVEKTRRVLRSSLTKEELTQTGLPKSSITKVKTIEHAIARENFAELYMIYSRRNGKFKTVWNNLQKTHPYTVEVFNHLIGDLNAQR